MNEELERLLNDMTQVQQSLDYISVMAYDFCTVGPQAGHHTNLYASGKVDHESSGDQAVKRYKQAGVPAEKLVLGLAFYGRAWQLQNGNPKAQPRTIVKAEHCSSTQAIISSYSCSVLTGFNFIAAGISPSLRQ